MRDRFLTNVLEAFRRRQKAIRYRTKRFEIETQDSPEKVFISSDLYGGNWIVLEMTAGNRARLEVFSGNARSRGKVILREDILRLVDSASEIVEVFEWTIPAAGSTEGIDSDEIIARWKALTLASMD